MTTTTTTHPGVRDGRDGKPFDHSCSGRWTFTGLNKGGHEIYHCDAGHWLIGGHANPDHRCAPRCTQAWAIRKCTRGKVIGSRIMPMREAEREVALWGREIGRAAVVPFVECYASTVRAEVQSVLAGWLS